MKLHQKGFLLTELSKVAHMWDHQLIKNAFIEYGESGDFREKSIRIALDELSAAGLVRRIDEKLEATDGTLKLMFNYQLSDFGISRMVDTGLLLP
ncbi:MAG: hypothetical protein Q8Q76_10345 [Methylotenera sp.]|nr:hypothetical protein [Methylotenera sp.]